MTTYTNYARICYSAVYVLVHRYLNCRKFCTFIYSLTSVNHFINMILSEDIVKYVFLATLPIFGSKSPSTPKVKNFEL